MAEFNSQAVKIMMYLKIQSVKLSIVHFTYFVIVINCDKLISQIRHTQAG